MIVLRIKTVIENLFLTCLCMILRLRWLFNNSIQPVHDPNTRRVIEGERPYIKTTAVTGMTRQIDYSVSWQSWARLKPKWCFIVIWGNDGVKQSERAREKGRQTGREGGTCTLTLFLSYFARTWTSFFILTFVCSSRNTIQDEFFPKERDKLWGGTHTHTHTEKSKLNTAIHQTFQNWFYFVNLLKSSERL